MDSLQNPDDVPQAVKRLIRTVMRSFYSIEYVLFMDMLLRKPGMKDEDLLNNLKLDPKTLRGIIQQLKNDKMIKQRLRMETSVEGKATRQTYNFISYRNFVNVVKYKLHHMRLKIEAKERDNTSRASFICTECRKTYTDLEVDQLIDMETGEFKCRYCFALVEEDPSAVPPPDSRLVMGNFNDQVEPIYLLLKELEDYNLPTDHFDTDLIDSNLSLNPDRQPGAASTSDGFGSRSRRPGSFDNINTHMVVNIEGYEERDARIKKEDDELAKKRKEQPVWMSGSTVHDDDNHPANNGSAVNSPVNNRHHHKKHKEEKEDRIHNQRTSTNDNPDEGLAKEIIEYLMTHERVYGQEAGTKEATNFLSKSQNHSPSSSMYSPSTSYSIPYQNGGHLHKFTHGSHLSNGGDDVMMESDEDDDDFGPYITLKGQRIPLKDVTESMIEGMSEEETNEFVRIAQDVYSYLYD